MQRNEKKSDLQKIYVGIDVHLKSWDVTCMSGKYFKKSFVQPADAKALASYLRMNFPDAEYLAVYESGFSGYSTYYALIDEGIDTIIANAADVPTTQKEAVMKTDRRDSAKLAQALKNGDIEGIYVHPKDNLDDRDLVRLRKKYVKEESAYKVRIKHLLHCNGVEIPPQYKSWTKAYATWLREEVCLLGESKSTLLYMVDHVEILRRETLAVSSAVNQLTKSEKYAPHVRRLTTIPGVGYLLAITLLVEIGDFTRFNNEKAFACALGLVPTSHDSGPHVSTGEKTFRSNRHISVMFVEACWKMIGNDAAMYNYFCKCAKRMPKNKAIIKVARRLSNIIFSMMKNCVDYDPTKI